MLFGKGVIIMSNSIVITLIICVTLIAIAFINKDKGE